jgi:hypothetical protein
MAKEAASAATGSAGPATATARLASSGPMTNAAIPNPDTSAFPAVRDRGGRSSATSVYWPDTPQACSSEDAASSATYDPARKAPNAYNSGITLSVTARSAASAATRCLPASARSGRASSTAPAAPGSV